jgi:hypothetical protein
MPLDQFVDRVVPYQPEEKSRLLLRIRKWETLRVVGKEYSQQRSSGFRAKLSAARLPLKIGAVLERTVRGKESRTHKSVQRAWRRADSACAHQILWKVKSILSIDTRALRWSTADRPRQIGYRTVPRTNRPMPKADWLRHVLDRCLSLALTCGEVFCLGSRSRNRWLQLISMQGWRQ